MDRLVGERFGFRADEIQSLLEAGVVATADATAETPGPGRPGQPRDMCVQGTGTGFCEVIEEQAHMGTVRIPLSA